MEFKVNQIITVVDKVDNKERKCKVIKVENEKKILRIHYINWKSSHDEDLAFDSPRIVVEKELHNDSDAEDSFFDSEDSSDYGTAMGKLLRAVDTDSRAVIAKYDIRMTNEAREKVFNKFSVSVLESCAQNMHILVKNKDGKKLLTKKPLVKAILKKIESLLPQNCGECKAPYITELSQTPLFSCHSCGKPSHDCASYTTMKDSAPFPMGIVWMCPPCLNMEPEPELPKSSDLSEDDVTIVPIVEDVASNNNDGSKSQNPPVEVKRKNPNSNTKKDICSFYLRRECRHGRRGLKCNFDHPNICLKYTKRGSKKGGCNKGKDCDYVHPPLCRGSKENRMVCPKPGCKLYHLLGMKTTSRDECQLATSSLAPPSQPRPSQWRDSKKAMETNQSQRHKNLVPPMAEEPRESPVVQVAASNVMSGNDFLELKSQMASMMSQIQWIMAAMRIPPPASPRTVGWQPLNV